MLPTPTAAADGCAPLRLLEAWLAEAAAKGVESSHAAALCTVSADGHPSTRMISVKRVERHALLFTSALWTRKARDIAANPNVSLLFFWPALGRQVHVAGTAVHTGRALSERLFADRPRDHQIQTAVSRQGAVIDCLGPLRRERERLASAGTPPNCPDNWGAYRVRPRAVEFWQESADRLHDRSLYTRRRRGWTRTRLAP